MAGGGEALATGLVGQRLLEIRIEKLAQGLDDEGVASQAGAPGGPVQLLA
jgi:hypothetical protein